jgi:hypothetical protein
VAVPDSPLPDVPVLEALPLGELVPLLPLLPLSCCCGNGDSLPPLDWLEPSLVLVLPPEVDGDAVGDDDPEGLGNDGGDGIDGLCVEVLTAQPASPSAQATGQTNPLTITSRMLRVSSGSRGLRGPGADSAQPLGSAAGPSGSMLAPGAGCPRGRDPLQVGTEQE